MNAEASEIVRKPTKNGR